MLLHPDIHTAIHSDIHAGISTAPSSSAPVHRTGLAPGDLLFMQSPGAVQRLVESARDRFRHTAIVVEVGGHLWVVEAGRAGFRGRPLSTVLDRYHRIEALRLSGCDAGCADRVVAAALTAMEEPTVYPGRTDLAVAGLLSYSRTYLRGHRSSIRSAVHAVARPRVRQRCAGLGRRPTLCASLVIGAVADTCPLHRPRIDLQRPKHAEIVEADPLAGDYALPDDLWRALHRTPGGVETWAVDPQTFSR